MHGLDLESCNDIMTTVVLASDGRFIKGEEVKPKNLFFILSDQHNRNVTGACGNPHVQTPNLDRFAEGGAAVFLSGNGVSFITGEIVAINGGFWLA